MLAALPTLALVLLYERLGHPQRQPVARGTVAKDSSHRNWRRSNLCVRSQGTQIVLGRGDAASVVRRDDLAGVAVLGECAARATSFPVR